MYTPLLKSQVINLLYPDKNVRIRGWVWMYTPTHPPPAVVVEYPPANENKTSISPLDRQQLTSAATLPLLDAGPEYPQPLDGSHPTPQTPPHDTFTRRGGPLNDEKKKGGGVFSSSRVVDQGWGLGPGGMCMVGTPLPFLLLSFDVQPDIQGSPRGGGVQKTRLGRRSGQSAPEAPDGSIKKN